MGIRYKRTRRGRRAQRCFPAPWLIHIPKKKKEKRKRKCFPSENSRGSSLRLSEKAAWLEEERAGDAVLFERRSSGGKGIKSWKKSSLQKEEISEKGVPSYIRGGRKKNWWPGDVLRRKGGEGGVAGGARTFQKVGQGSNEKKGSLYLGSKGYDMSRRKHQGRTIVIILGGRKPRKGSGNWDPRWEGCA